MHIRRGDYISNPQTSRLHNICSLDYYVEASRQLTSLVADPHFYIFSDDPVWARDNLRLSHPMTVVDHNPTSEAHEDLRLMSLCRHHIIANSSFSWWGAWLVDVPDKLVFAPAKWFENYAHDIQDFVPPRWHLVSLSNDG